MGDVAGLPECCSILLGKREQSTAGIMFFVAEDCKCQKMVSEKNCAEKFVVSYDSFL